MRSPTRFSVCAQRCLTHDGTLPIKWRAASQAVCPVSACAEIVAKQLGFIFVLSRSKQRADDSAQRQITIGGRFVAQAHPNGKEKGRLTFGRCKRRRLEMQNRFFLQERKQRREFVPTRTQRFESFGRYSMRLRIDASQPGGEYIVRAENFFACCKTCTANQGTVIIIGAIGKANADAQRDYPSCSATWPRHQCGGHRVPRND